MATPFTQEQLKAAGANPNMYATPGQVTAKPATGVAYKTAGGQVSTDPSVLNGGVTSFNIGSDADTGFGNGMVSVPGVGIVPQGQYGTMPPPMGPQPSPYMQNAGIQQNQLQGPQAQQQPMENIETPATTPAGQRAQATLQNLNASGKAAPVNASEARVAVSKATPLAPQAEYKPTPEFIQYGDPIMQSYIQNVQAQQQEIAAKGYLAQSIKGVASNQLAQLDEKAMNMKAMIEGTEDDIRRELGKAGGFVTESQVKALANSRNKDLIRSYNSILIEKGNMQSQLQSQVQLAEADREFAQNKLNNNIQLFNIAEKINNNSTQSLNDLLSDVGYSGMSTAYNGDPYALGLAEQKLGLAPGSLSDPTRAKMLDSFKLKDKDPLDIKLKQLQIARAERELYGSPSSGGKNTPGATGGSPGPTSDQPFVDVIESTANLLGAVRQPSIRQNLNRAIESGDYESAYTQIGNVVEEMLPGAAQNTFANARTDANVLQGLRNSIQKYAAGGGNMGYLTGKEEEIKRKLGIDSGKASALATELWREFQMYRSNMTGAAFSAAESRDYAAVNPTLGKSLDLNLNVIDGAINQLNNRVNSTIKTRVPGALKIGDLATKGYSVTGLRVMFTDGSSISFPNQSELDKFKTDHESGNSK